MAKHVVAAVKDFPPGERRALTLGGRPVVIFNIKGEYFALLNKCPHQGAPLSHAHLTGLAGANGVGQPCISRIGEILTCPNHGWEFDVRTGQSWFDPAKTRVRTYTSEVSSGGQLVKGPYKAETFQVEIDQDYVVVTV